MPNNLHYIATRWLVGGTSIACLTIYATYTQWLVSRTLYDFTNTEATVSWTSSRGVELMASNKDKGGEGKGTD